MTVGQGDLGGHHDGDGAADPAHGKMPKRKVTEPRSAQANPRPTTVEPMLYGTGFTRENESRLTELTDDGTGTGGGHVHARDDTDARALSLGVDSAGGFAVPYQLDGKKRKPEKKGGTKKP